MLQRSVRTASQRLQLLTTGTEHRGQMVGKQWSPERQSEPEALGAPPSVRHCVLLEQTPPGVNPPPQVVSASVPQLSQRKLARPHIIRLCGAPVGMQVLLLSQQPPQPDCSSQMQP